MTTTTKQKNSKGNNGLSKGLDMAALKADLKAEIKQDMLAELQVAKEPSPLAQTTPKAETTQSLFSWEGKAIPKAVQKRIRYEYTATKSTLVSTGMSEDEAAEKAEKATRDKWGLPGTFKFDSTPEKAKDAPDGLTVAQRDEHKELHRIYQSVREVLTGEDKITLDPNQKNGHRNQEHKNKKLYYNQENFEGIVLPTKENGLPDLDWQLDKNEVTMTIAQLKGLLYLAKFYGRSRAKKA